MLCLCLYALVMLFFFVFFKQKTAYEMRISDWSSDVCSSDLIGQPVHERLVAEVIVPAPVHTVRLKWIQAIRYENSCPPALLQQIGRASCRERVCQYV